MTFEVAGSMASVPMSPQSSDSAQRPETNRLRVSPTSRLISFGGPYWVVSLRKSSALAKASLLTSGFMSRVSKKTPWPVPFDWIMPPAIEVMNQ